MMRSVRHPGEQAVSPGPGQPQAGSAGAWYAVHGDRGYVPEWTGWLGAYDRMLADGFSPFHQGCPMVVMPAFGVRLSCPG